MKINDRLINQLKVLGVENITPSILYLLAIYYGLDHKYVPLDKSEMLLISKYISIKDGKLVVKEEDLFEDGIITPITDDINYIVEYYIEDYRNLFDGLFIGSKGSLASVRKKMIRFLKDSGYSIDDLMEAAEYAVRNKGKYAGQADYFLYKREKDGTEVTRAINTLEELRKETGFIKII